MKIEGNSKNSKEYKIQANKNILYFNFLICFIFYFKNIFMGIGDWGLGIGDWAQSPIPNPQSPYFL